MTAKETLMDVGLRLFAEVGYENTGVAQIVSEAGVTKPTMYHHYGNKDGLLKSIINTYGKELTESLGGTLLDREEVNETMDRLAIRYIGFAKKYPVFFRLYKQLYSSPEGSDSYRIIKPYYDEVMKEIQKIFLETASYHTNLKDKEVWMSYSIMGMFDAYILHHIREADLATLSDDTCRQAAKQFLYGVFPV